jgi:type II secretory pathway pseudopilin PulG
MPVVQRQRGDTVIEVMLAFTVFAMLAVGAISVMNRGTASSQDTLETTQVRQEIDNQAEMLRYMHQAYLVDPDATDGLAGEFNDIMTLAESTANPSEFGAQCTSTLPATNENYRFALNTGNGSLITGSGIAPISSPNATSPYARVVNEDGGAAYGLWVEPVMSNDSDPASRYIDFHIRACWEGASSAPQRTLGTIVRLYVPANEDTGSSGGTSPEPVPAPATLSGERAGSEHVGCYVHTLLNVNGVTNPPLPAWNPLNDTQRAANSGSHLSGCIVDSSFPTYLVSFSNFDVSYSVPTGFTSNPGDEYNLIINYRDASCPVGCGTTDGGANGYTNDFNDPNYRFKVAIYVNGDYQRVVELPVPAGRESNGLASEDADSPAVNIGRLEENDVITLRWWNNQYVRSGSTGANTVQDPDLVIGEVRWELDS